MLPSVFDPIPLVSAGTSLIGSMIEAADRAGVRDAQIQAAKIARDVEANRQAAQAELIRLENEKYHLSLEHERDMEELRIKERQIELAAVTFKKYIAYLSHSLQYQQHTFDRCMDFCETQLQYLGTFYQTAMEDCITQKKQYTEQQEKARAALDTTTYAQLSKKIRHITREQHRIERAFAQQQEKIQQLVRENMHSHSINSLKLEQDISKLTSIKTFFIEG